MNPFLLVLVTSHEKLWTAKALPMQSQQQPQETPYLLKRQRITNKKYLLNR